MRILVTGSRDWDDRAAIYQAMNFYGWPEYNKGQVLVSGACPTGADRIAEEIAETFVWQVERHPAQWRTYGKRAGFVRNAEMVKLGATICLAFIKNGSNGATMTANLAEKAGIRTVRFFKGE